MINAGVQPDASSRTPGTPEGWSAGTLPSQSSMVRRTACSMAAGRDRQSRFESEPVDRRADGDLITVCLQDLKQWRTGDKDPPRVQSFGKEVPPGVLRVPEVEARDVVDQPAICLFGTFSSKHRLSASIWNTDIRKRLATTAARQELVSPRTKNASG
jgi:hypothetical protein